MGLDLTAYRKLTPAPDAKVDSDGNPKDWENLVAFSRNILSWTEEHWPGRSKPITPGVYRFTEKFGFRGGSYSGYNWWRDKLAMLAHGKTAKALWDEPEAGPFAELIFFADNEGVIGSEVAAKLAKDFAEWQERADAFKPNNDDEPSWWLEGFNNWRKAFEIAADGGAVDFH